MTKGHRPRRGSMAFYPRKRARSIVARVRSWPRIDETRLVGFAGYKVGMLHVLRVETNPNSPFYGQEIMKPATVIESPPLMVLGARFYRRSPYGLRCLTEVWDRDIILAKEEGKDDYLTKFSRDLERVFTVPKPDGLPSDEEVERRVELAREGADEARLILATQPRKAGIHKKKPEVFEVPVGGSIEEAISYALERMGKEISVGEVFEEGQYVDVISVTKGKGYQGVVKRFGVKILPRWHKHRKGHRRIGSVGPTKPAIMFTTPMAGQLGFHQRTEYNKLVLKIGSAGDESFPVNPPGGWPHYGVVRSEYVLLEGTVPGPPKRLVKMRLPVRPKEPDRVKIQITYASLMPVGGE